MAFYQLADAEEFEVSGAEVSGTLSYTAYHYAGIADVFAAAVSSTPTSYAGGARIRIRPQLVGGKVWRVDVAYGTPTAKDPYLDANTPTTFPPDPPAADPNNSAPVADPPQPLPALEGQLGGPPGAGSIDPPGGGDGGDGTGGGLPDPIQRDAPLGPEWTFDTTGGTVKVLQSRSVKVSKVYGAGGGAAPDVRKAIGATTDGVEGVDITFPRLKVGVTWPVRRIAGGYLDALSALTGCVNNAPFLFWDKGEVLFEGASGRYQSPGGWSVTYGFSVSKSEANIKIVEPKPAGNADEQAGLVIDFKEGHDYLDVGYSDAEVGGRVLKLPDRAYVHEVYRRADLSALGFQ